MIGFITRLPKNSDSFAFVKTREGDFFLHRDDFNGRWSDLIKAVNRGAHPKIEFEVSDRNDKGPRACNAKFMEYEI